MPVFEGSRYSGVQFTALRDASGRVIRYLHNREPVTQKQLNDPTILAPIQEQEDLDSLAHLLTGTSTKWHLIAEVNEIFWAFDQEEGGQLEPGTELIIPSVDEMRRLI
jgi:hypothetical protein